MATQKRSVNRRLSPSVDYTPIIRKFGDWQKTKYLLATIDTTIALAASKAEASAAKKLQRIVRRNIRENGGSLGWEPVSAKYAKYKTSQGYDPTNLLQMTNLYYNSIKTWEMGDRHFIGVKKNIFHPESDLTVGTIARILEHGSTVRNIPARPLWAPSYKQFGGTLRIRRLIIWHLRNEIYKNYGIRLRISITDLI